MIIKGKNKMAGGTKEALCLLCWVCFFNGGGMIMINGHKKIKEENTRRVCTRSFHLDQGLALNELTVLQENKMKLDNP